MNCLIVDSELMARKYLKKLCGKIPGLKVVQVCGSIDRALKIVEQSDIDLLFIDIVVSDEERLKQLKQLSRNPNVIITFSNQGVDIDAFNGQVTDFIRKPISFHRFKQVVDQVFLELPAKRERFVDDEEIFIKDHNRFVRVRYEDILYIENVGDYARIVTSKDSILTYGTIKSIATKLPDKYFVRVHRSYIVNWRKIVDIEASSLIIEEKVIPVSRKLRSHLMGRLNVL